MLFATPADARFAEALADYREPAMDTGIRAELDDFVERRKREGGAPTDF